MASILLLLLFCAYATGCDVSQIVSPKTITDVSKPKPFTWTNTFTMVEGNCGGRTDLNRYLFTCSAVFGTSTFHPLPGSKIHFAVSAVTSTKFVFVFPSLIMTDLHPGNTLTIGWAGELRDCMDHAVTSGHYKVLVASSTSTPVPTASNSSSSPPSVFALPSITGPPSGSTSQTFTTSPTVQNYTIIPSIVASSMSYSLRQTIGIVAGSILGAFIVIAAIYAFAWYKVSMRKSGGRARRPRAGMWSDEEDGENNRDSGRLGGIVLE